MKNVKAGHTHPIVCLDAGHYGKKYNHSPVVEDYYESEAMWRLTAYEKAELERYGIEVWLTRRNIDDNPGLSERGRMAADADGFGSNHSNACNSEKVDRVCGICFVDDDCGAADEASRELATLMAQTVAEVMQTNDPVKIYSRAADFDRDKDGRLDDEYYGVLKGAHEVKTPGFILEHSFHTNTRAAEWLLRDENLKRLAKAKAKAWAQWFDLPTEDTGSSGSGSAPEPDPVPEIKAVNVEDPESFNKSYAGTYLIQSDDGILNLRSGAGSKKTLVEAMKSGQRVYCQGEYTGKWLLVVSESHRYGYCHKSYLEKM